VRLGIEVADEKKAQDVAVLDVRKAIGIADYFVIVSGENRRQIQAIAEEIQARYKRDAGYTPTAEGLETGRWVLVDLDTVVVHVFDRPTRELYALEHLWADVPRVPASALAAHLHAGQGS
jgi:ribosome-associated protein